MTWLLSSVYYIRFDFIIFISEHFMNENVEGVMHFTSVETWKVNSKHFLNVEKAHKKVIICKIRNIQASVLLYLKKLFTILIVCTLICKMKSFA